MTEPLPGDFGLCRIAGAVGLGIRLGQWLAGGGFADYEHAFIYLGARRILEAQPGGAVGSDLAEYADRPILWSTDLIALTAAQRAAITDAARRYAGVPYSFADYLAITAHRLHLPLPGLRRYVASTRHMQCAQLVDAGFQQAGVHLFTDDRWPGYVMPASLHSLIG